VTSDARAAAQDAPLSARTSGSVIVAASAVSHSYRSPIGPVPVLNQIDLTVTAGEFVAILGPSGSGKSTLLNLIGGLENPSHGTIRVCGQDVSALSAAAMERYRQHTVAFVFQFFNLLPSLTALENVMLGLEAMEPSPPDPSRTARRHLDLVGLSDKVDRYPAHLSGGEQQRVAVARALAKRVPLILADEPTGNLDEDTAAEVMGLFARIRGESGAAIILITHDPVVAAGADRRLRLVKGRLLPESAAGDGPCA
jgi:putative ABC transport system ATP-binding protein